MSIQDGELRLSHFNGQAHGACGWVARGKKQNEHATIYLSCSSNHYVTSPMGVQRRFDRNSITIQ
jgi:hypothetical protein